MRRWLKDRLIDFLTHPVSNYERRAENDVDAFRAASAGALLNLVYRSAIGDLAVELRSPDVARRADAAQALRLAGVDLHGYDPDASEELREAAVRKIVGVSDEER